ncbi:hypothetical protein SynA18461_00192 [Synechococcus sp. A18-46.1]|nr:hypothetical protein SynA18461_00192 [Synechococcus sp. A18-46.1]
METVEAIRSLARTRSRIHQLGENSRSYAPGDNYDLSRTQEAGRDSRINSDNTNITINTEGGNVIIEKLYLVLDMEDYWGIKDKEI